MNNPSYAVISPVRNEADYLGFTIASLQSQTVRPAIWVIVNDGSSDETSQIAKAAARQFDWIHVIDRPDRGIASPVGALSMPSMTVMPTSPQPNGNTWSNWTGI